MKRFSLIGSLIMGLAAGVGCGSDGPGNDAVPRIIVGGGAGDGAIDGLLHVHVIDGETDAPIAGARVLIGEAGEEPLEGLTDSAGLLSFEHGRLDGPTTVTVVASGYVVSTWYGANAANLTIPVDKSDESTVVKKATLRGTISDWDTLEAAPQGQFRAAFISYSQSDDVGDESNNIEQPGGDPAPNMCVITVPATPCNWSVITRAGKVAVFATIINYDPKGTADESDDVITTISLAYKLDLMVEDGVNMSAITLELADAADLETVTLNVPAAPSGLDEVGAGLGVDTGDHGVMFLGFGQNATTIEVLVPKLTGDFAGMTYRALAFAGDSNDPEDGEENKMSASIKRGITSGGTIDLDPWMPMASGMTQEAGVYSFTAVSGASFHGAKLIDENDDDVWSVALLDGRTSFELPAVTPDPIPSGSLDMAVDAFDGDVDVQDFEIDAFIDTFKRISKGRETLQ